MIKRSANAPETEPEQGSFEIPSEREHLFQVVDIFDQNYKNNVLNLDIDTVCVKCEVVGGDESGRSILQRLSLNDQWKGFFATRLFLKVIGEPHKGQIEMDTDFWVGTQFRATVEHNVVNGKTYANIKEYNFENPVDNSQAKNFNKVSSENKTKGIDEVGWDDNL